eukprot:gene17279-19005_t
MAFSMAEDVLYWEGKAKGRGKERHLFLFEKLLLGTKAKEMRNDECTYCYKFSMKMTDAGLTESIEGDAKRWRMWIGKTALSANVQKTFEVKTPWAKQSWVKDLREILSSQLSALKESSKRKSAPQIVSDNDDMRPKVTMVRSKSDAPISEITGDESSLFTPIHNAEESVAASLKEPCSLVQENSLIEDLMAVEEAYIAKELGVSRKETEPIVIGSTYMILTEAKSRSSDKVLLKKGEHVTALKPGDQLFLVQAQATENGPRRCWVPAHWLSKLGQLNSTDNTKSVEDSKTFTEASEPPNFILQLEPRRALEGDTVTFKCQVDDCQAKIEWTLNEEILEQNEFTRFESNDDGTRMLVLQGVSVEFEGHYGVIASNSAGATSCMSELLVSVPPKFVEKIQDGDVEAGGTHSFQALIEGHPTPKVVWFFKSKEIKDEGRFLVETVDRQAILDISDIENSDGGEYTCTVINEAGEDSCRATLKVLGPPAEPGRPKVETVTDNSVTLSWIAPKDDGGSDVMYYMVEQRNEDDRIDDWDLVDDHVTSTRRVVNELATRDEYMFRVSACNKYGWSKSSKVSAMVVVKDPAKKSPAPVIKEAYHSDSDREYSGSESCRSETDDEVATISKGGSKMLSLPDQPPEMVAARLSPFSLLKDRRMLSGNEDQSSSDESCLSPKARPTRSRSPLLFTSSRSNEKNKIQEDRNNKPLLYDEDNNEIPFGPPFFTRELEDCFIFENNAAKFICRAAGNPEPEVEWFKDGEKVLESKQFTMLFDADDNCVLIITQGTSDAAGKFTCVAKNSEGTVTSSAMLYVEGLVTEYESESEDEVSDPEPLPERDPVVVRKEDVENSYTLKDELGRGKFGIVSNAVHTETQREYAAKFIKCRPRDKKVVYGEIEIMNQLNHKRLVQLYGAFETSKNIVLILELVTGGELFEKLTALEYISEHVVVYYMKQVLQGLKYMHEKQILHLDLKPENIMLVNPNSNQVKLIDFGLARKYNPSETLQVLVGTPEFIAPEVIGYETVSTATDMWSIGVITYVLLSGLSPFMGDNDAETLANVTTAEWDFDDPVFEDISQEAKEFITDLLVKNQKGKFAVIKKCTKKKTGEAFAAKLVKYDEDTQEFAKKEFHIWNGLSHPNLLVLHDAFLVRKYLILISDLVTGEQILDYLGKMENTSEEDVTSFVTQLIEALEYLHARQIVHLDIKPGNLMIKGTVLKLIDYGSSRKITNELGEVGEMVGTAEFMAPETINFEPVSWATDIWGVGVVTYALLSGLSPFACEDEDETMASVTALDYRFDPQAFATITEEAKSFIKSIVIRIPEKRPTATKLLEHSWFAEAFTKARESSLLDQDALLDLSEVLKDQDKLEEVRASAVLRTFLQSPHESPVSSEAEDDDEDGDDNDDVDE